MSPACVKYLVGFKAAGQGIRSFAELARRVGISPQYLSNILACRERPAKHQQAIADLLDCEPVELFGESTARELAAAPKRRKRHKRKESA